VSIQSELKSRSDLDYETNIIAVSKTFSIDVIKPLIEHGHLHYGENKVQEAVRKWTEIKKNKEDLKLHMIGKLQSNKVKYVVPLFDYIHSLDNLKLAEKISSEQKKVNRKLKIFIQVNIGDEDQKNGIHKNQVPQFFKKCINDFNLDIIGLMCIPPVNKDINSYFSSMNELNNSLGLNQLSMGMSSDYLKAIEHGATFVRIGSKIFGNRI
tara:strand:+ start:1644 stop:2273 length:630 start_codon:yes stop_codon:yes gene_type:complete